MVCYREQGEKYETDVAEEEEDEEENNNLMYISYIAVFPYQPTIVYSEPDSKSNCYIRKIVGDTEINPEPTTWSEKRNSMGQIVTYLEWLARIAIYHEQSPIFNILYNRLSFCCNVMCEHNLRKYVIVTT